MADITRYADFALNFDTVAAPFEAGSLEAGNDPAFDDLMSGSALNVALRQVVGKRPYIKATLLDPSLVTTWTKFVTGESIESVIATWRQYAQDGGLGATYLGATLASGILIPVTLSGGARQKATMDIVAFGHYAGGVGFAIGSTSKTQAAVTKAFYPTSITVGGVGFTEIVNMSVTWEYQTEDDEQLEPTYYYYSRYTMRGSATLKDLSKATVARLEDGVSETVVVLFTDANSAGTVSVDLGTCQTFASMRGGECQLEFSKIG